MSKKNNSPKWWEVLLVILFILLTAGLILALLGQEHEKIEEDTDGKRERLRNRLKEVMDRITPLAAKRDELRFRERKRLFWIRILIAVNIIGCNIFLWRCYNLPYDVGKQLTYNEAGLLIYAFLGFIIAGTPSRFAILMKQGVARWFTRKHKPMLIELESLERERDEIIKELNALGDA